MHIQLGRMQISSEKKTWNKELAGGIKIQGPLLMWRLNQGLQYQHQSSGWSLSFPISDPMPATALKKLVDNDPRFGPQFLRWETQLEFLAQLLVRAWPSLVVEAIYDIHYQMEFFVFHTHSDALSFK